MNRNRILLVAAALFLPLLAGCPKPNGDPSQITSQVKWKPYNGKKMRVAITSFSDSSGYREGQVGAKGATRMTATALTNSNHFQVFEEAQVNKVMQQLGFQNSGLVTPESAAQVGKLIGAQFVLAGNITQLGVQDDFTNLIYATRRVVTYKVTIDFSLVNVQTGETVVADSQSAQVSDTQTFVLGIGKSRATDDQSKVLEAVRDAVDKAAQNIVDKTPTSGFDFKVAAVSGGKVTINAGDGEFKPGQQLRVYRPGAEVKDPETGQVVDIEVSEVGMIEVAEVKGKVSYCKVIKGKDFRAGDIVRP
jgi:curli biogenesis system outer membrane secretion channel CsgG